MRIRTIKPEFWRSRDISDLNIEDRFLFIGLWSYVDDNGVGVYDVAIIAAELFAHDLSRDSRETLARVSGGLQRLSDKGLITLYSDEKRDLLHINTWTSHQRIDKPGKARYPRPDAVRDTLATSSRDSRDTLAPGTEEQSTRGTVLITPPSPSLDADAPTETEEVANENQPTPKPKPKPKPRTYPDDFQAFWDAYPRRTAKADAYKAWKAATKRASTETITTAAARYAADPNLPDPQYIPYPATWLRSDSWDNPPEPPRHDLTPTQRRLQATLTHGLTWAAQDPHDHALESTQEDPPWQITA